MIKPGQPNPLYDVELSDGKAKTHWGLKLDGGAKAIQQTTSTTDSLAVVLHAVGKKMGDFDEQRDWTGGRGKDYFNDDPTGYYDARHAWTLSPLKVHPVPQWYYAKGYRACQMEMPGSVTWKALIGDNRYLSTSFSPDENFPGRKYQLWIRRRGNPGTLTLNICGDSAGVPGTSVGVATVTTDTITDVLSELHSFYMDSTTIYATPITLLTGVTYHLKLYSAATDTSANHWEVGVDTSITTTGHYSAAGSSWTDAAFSMYYRISGYDSTDRWYGWMWNGTMYVISQPESGYSVMKKWDEASDSFSTEYLAGTTGITSVTSCPVVNGAYCYFPQGESVLIRWWNGTTTWYDDTANYATFLLNHSDVTNGPQLVKANTTVGTTSSVAYAAIPAADPPHTFGTAIKIGDTSTPITNILSFQNKLYVFKSDGIWEVEASGKLASYLDAGMRQTQSTRNGRAVTATGDFLYYSWLNTVMRRYDYTSTVDDVGQAWRGQGLPSSRTGNISCLLPVCSWLFASIDAGDSGTSSVHVWDGKAWHELFRAPEAGRRIRSIWWQPSETQRDRLWIDCGGDLVYVNFPLDVAGPVKDSGMTYHHEFVLTSSIIEMSTAAKLPKYIRDLTISTENLTDLFYNRPGNDILVDVQTDEKVGLDGVENWTQVGACYLSPEEIIQVNLGDIRKFRYRLRGYTTINSIPPIVTNVTPSGFARSPFRRVWNLRILTGEILRDGSKVSSYDLNEWLLEAASFPGRVKMTSIFPELHDKYIVVAPPNILPVQGQETSDTGKTVTNVTLMEL